MLKAAMPAPTAPRLVVKSPVLCPGSTPRIAWVCVTAMKAPPTSAAPSQARPIQSRCRSRAIATTTPEGTSPMTSGVHSPMIASAPSGSRNQPRVRADRQLRALT